jgi:hypothetical protein
MAKNYLFTRNAFESFLREMALSDEPFKEKFSEAFVRNIFQHGIQDRLPDGAADRWRDFCEYYFGSPVEEIDEEEVLEKFSRFDDHTLNGAFNILMKIKNSLDSSVTGPIILEKA